MPTLVLDASALLAYLGDETGAVVVADAIAGGATISTVNLAEAFSTLASRGVKPEEVLAADLADRGPARWSDHGGAVHGRGRD